MNFISLIKLLIKIPVYMRHLLTKKIRLYQRYRWANNHPQLDQRVPLPVVIKILLTSNCNLRCQKCMQWGRSGWHLQQPAPEVQSEIDFEIILKIFKETAPGHPSFILSGGEPLLYSRFDELAKLLQKNRQSAEICTNGTLVDRYLRIIDRNPYLSFLISLDGLSEVNDHLRGPGVFRQVTENIKLLKKLKKPPYLGIQFTVRPENGHQMFDFCREMIKLKVDWILFNPSWFLTETQRQDYVLWLEENFQVTPNSQTGYQNSFPLNKEEFVRQFRLIRGQKWPVQIASYLEKPEEIYPFVENPKVPTANKFCYKQWARADISERGQLVACAQFPDLSFGNLKDNGFMDLWNSPEYARFRTALRRQFLPVCAKCNALYLYDINRKHL